MAAQCVCSIEGCGKPVRARRLCSGHYQRLVRHGDPEAGRAKDGEPAQFIADVALTNSGDDCLDWPFGKCRGRGLMKVGGRTRVAARVVCAAAHGPPPSKGLDSAHSCGNALCVNPRHLRWATRKENEADKLIHGTRQRGERHGLAKISEADARRLLSMKGTVSKVAAAAMFGLHPTTVGQIWRGERWSHIIGDR